MDYGLIGVIAGVAIILIVGAPVMIWGERDPTQPKSGVSRCPDWGRPLGSKRER